MERQIIYPRRRVGPTEWIMERRVLIACALGAGCFIIGFLAAGPRLNAGSRTAYAPPEIVVQPNPVSAPTPAARPPLAPDIKVIPVSEPSTSVSEIEVPAEVGESTERKAERPRRKKRIRPKPKVESPEPVVVYAPPKSREDREMEESFRRELERDPEIDP